MIPWVPEPQNVDERKLVRGKERRKKGGNFLPFFVFFFLLFFGSGTQGKGVISDVKWHTPDTRLLKLPPGLTQDVCGEGTPRLHHRGRSHSPEFEAFNWKHVVNVQQQNLQIPPLGRVKLHKPIRVINTKDKMLQGGRGE